MPEDIRIPVSAARVIKNTIMRSKDSRVAALKALGADDETVKMVLEVDRQIDIIKARHPDIVAAWGLGCGGVSC